jgi:uncharacterized damage-inducible protein DinB
METIDKSDAADLDFSPFEGAYTVRQVLLHIAQEEGGELQFGITREISKFPPAYPVEAYPTVAAAKALLAKVHEKTSRFLSTASDEQLGEEIETGWGGTHRLDEMILHIMEHEIHHRGELSLMLGILGRKGLEALAGRMLRPDALPRLSRRLVRTGRLESPADQP